MKTLRLFKCYRYLSSFYKYEQKSSFAAILFMLISGKKQNILWEQSYLNSGYPKYDKNFGFQLLLRNASSMLIS